MSETHTHTRERLLDAAVAAGKFAEERRAHYRALYDRDPVVAAATIGVLTGFQRPTQDAAQHVNPVVREESSDATVEQVQAWTDQLFPEARMARQVEAMVQARGASAYPRVMSDGDD
jgi:hypothetical protein